MKNFGKAVVNCRIPILILALALLIPSIFGMTHTRINYDMLDYLPEDIETVQGQNLLLDEFGKGAFSLVMVEGMETKDIAKLRGEMENIDHVESVIWYDSLLSDNIPVELLPEKYYKIFNEGDTTMMAVFFDTSTSADETMAAISEIRSMTGKQCFVSGMSAMVTDLKELCEKEEPTYVAIAVILACVAMMLFLDSWILPFIFLASIGMAIMLNMGTNYFLGEVSYITQALSAVLQLAVTMDYSIFLWHSYSEEKVKIPGDKKKAMGNAIGSTITSVTGSSITTIAGFLALCFMSFTLGKDLGIVMAKGVILGVIGCVTTLPALILVFDKAIEKTRHKPLLRSMEKPAKMIVNHPAVFVILFLVLLVPAIFGYTHTETYYDLSESLPKDMEFVIANTKLQDEFDMSTTHMILADANLPEKDARAMLTEIEGVPGVKFALGLDSVIGTTVPEEVIPSRMEEMLKSENYQLMLVSSSYKVATEEVNEQIDTINTIIKKYDNKAMLIGEGPCTKDLITITDHDFQMVSIISIGAIFLIIALVLKSISLPFILVAVIEFAVFVNLGIPYYTGTSLAFVTPICISTIQLGATVDYAILMTTRYKKERYGGKKKKDAVETALSTSMSSILVSAVGFFAATFGVAVYSNIDMISSMCSLMARGAIISMLAVIMVLPAMFMIFDPLIIHTSAGFRPKANIKEEAK